MKKMLVVMSLVVSLALSAMPVWAGGNIESNGASVLAGLSAEAPKNATERELWEQLSSSEPRARAAAGVAMVEKMFPDGDPSRWNEVSGFLTAGGKEPRQLAAMDGLFTAVIELDKMDGGVWGAASLLQRFGKSAAGRVAFIDEAPRELRAAIDDVVARTGLSGDWSSKKVCGTMPILSGFEGYTTDGEVQARGMRYLDGYGSLAGNGTMAWDRNNGKIYGIMSNSSR